MQRRIFLAGVSGALASLPLTAFAAPSGGPKGDMGLLRSYVANRDQFPDAKVPQADEVLHLERRPRRAFDPASIAVMRSDGCQLGYLPPASTSLLATLLDEGFVAYAVALSASNAGVAELPVLVYLKKDLGGVRWAATS